MCWSNGCRLEIACNDIGVNIKTFRRWIVRPVDQRKGPVTASANKLSELEKAKVIEVSCSSEYCDLPPCQIVPRLADRGEYIASESTFYRILKANKMLKYRGKSKPRSTYKPTPLVATSPNEVWSWDITFLRSLILGQFFYLYMFMDVFSRKIVGWEVHEKESMIYSSELITNICQSEKVNKNQVTLHADNGGSMRGATMLATLQKLGIVPSFSRPSVSDDNPYSEALFKTLKYCPEYPSKPFDSIEAARIWVDKFVNWYNCDHLHSGIKFVTPNDRHEGRDEKILNQRMEIYELAKSKNSNRWSGKTRNWKKIRFVELNNLQAKLNFATKNAA